MKHSFWLLLLLLFSGSFVAAQRPSAGKGIRVSGRVLEKNSKSPIEFVTVMLKTVDTDELINGTTTNADGYFELRSPRPDFYVSCSFIGFSTKDLTDFKVIDGRVELKDILISEDGELLDEVVIRSEKSRTEFKLDKRVFNVGQDLASVGASALEVLNNVPSVTVNIEGEVALRGKSGVQILINGKPSVLASESGNALGSITADMIERVEVITNPSAKYEAEGSVGIINIVLRKEERKGINGSVSINTGIPHNHSVGLSLNRRTEKFNLFSQFGVGYRSLPYDNEQINETFASGVRLESSGTAYRDENFYNAILGADYHINDFNVLTLSGSFAYEIEDQPSDTYFDLFERGNLSQRWHRQEVTEATNPKWQYEIQYKSIFKQNKDHYLLFSAIGNHFSKSQTSDFKDTYDLGSVENNFQKTETDFGETKYTFNLDYTHPVSELVTIETGAQYVTDDVHNDYQVSTLTALGWEIDPGLTNVFDFTQNVLGIYSTVAYEHNKWGVKAGLRVENTEMNTLLETTREENDRAYNNWFPSFHASYKIREELSVQGGYSRRIFRPRLWSLNPFFNIRNNFNIRTGNPNLDPEFTDSYEVSGIWILDKLTLNLNTYLQYTTDVMERISIFENGVNTTVPENIGERTTQGVELNGKYVVSDAWVLSGDFNYSVFQRRGSFMNQVFDFQADQWSGRLVSKLRVKKDWDFEISGRLNSRVRNVQGTTAGNGSVDVGLRKKLKGGKTVISFNIRDLFETRIRENTIRNDDFYLYNYGIRGRFITLGVSYGFGKGEAMQYTGRRRH